MIFAGAMAVAMAVDALVGWPDALYARIGHPVTWIGAVIRGLDRRMNREADGFARRRILGVLAATGVIALSVALAVAVQALLPGGATGQVLTGILAWPLLAVRSMRAHVAAVARPLGVGDLAVARRAVSMIVGRDPERLDEGGVARAALESLAENTSDGIVAPVFWGAIFGLPGIAGYKAINTLDSMIGHRTPRHRAFGWAAARIDDVANLIPARLTGLLFAAVSDRPRAALATMARDARHHRSPNAGWPEAAMAGALGIRLSGPRIYADGVADEPWVNMAASDPGARDIMAGLALYGRAMVALGAVLLALGLVWAVALV